MDAIMDSRFPATSQPDPDWWRALWPDPESVLRSIGIDFGQEVLDLCCGDGHFTVPLAHVVGRAGHVTALDIDKSMIARARAYARSEGIADNAIDWIEADACKIVGRLKQLPDFILMANTFHGVIDKPAMMKEMFSSLMPGGRMAIINWHHRPREETTVLNQPRGPETKMRMMPDAVIDLATGAGFRLHGIVELPPYHYAAVFTKPKS